MNRVTILRWLRRLAFAIAIFVFLILFVVLPVGGSFLITNSRFRFRERGPKTAEEVGLSVTPVEFTSSDGIPLRGWWNPGDPAKPVIIFVHGLNRSRLELLTRGAESNRRGYGVLLFDLRNHGESGKAYTTLGIYESRKGRRSSTGSMGRVAGCFHRYSGSKAVPGIQSHCFGQFLPLIPGDGRAPS